MNIVIKATGMDLTSEVRELLEGKFSALGKFVERSGPAELSCEVEESIAAVRAGAKYRAEGTLRVDGKSFRAEAMHESLEGAVDRVRDELASELRSARGRERGLVRRGGAAFKRMLRFGR